MKVSRGRSRLGLEVGPDAGIGRDVYVPAWDFHGVTTNDIMYLLISPSQKVIATTQVAISVKIPLGPSSGLLVIASL